MAKTEPETIEALKREVEDCQAREQRYLSVLENMSDTVLITDAQGKLVYVCPNVQVIFNRGQAEVEALETIEALLGRGLPPVEELRAQKTVNNLEVPVVDQDGNTRRLLVTYQWLADEVEGDVLIVCRDATDLLQATERLRETHRVVGLGTWALDLRTGKVSWDERMHALTGRPLDGPVPLSGIRDYIHPDDRPRVKEATDRALVGGEPYDDEFRIVTPEGVVRTVRSWGWFERDDEGRPVLLHGSVQDLTEQRALERKVRQSQKMEAIGQLAGGVAHDFNNLLTAMMSYAYLAKDELPDRGQATQDLDELLATARRASELTTQLLSFARSRPVQPRVIAPGAVLANVEKLLRRVIGEGIELIVEVAEDTFTLRMDPTALEQVLINLAVNARDAMPEGGRLRVTAAPGEARGASAADVIITVEDTGTGIAPADLDHIFEPFFTTKPVGKGTGLGLSTSYGLVQQAGGEILVESTPGAGSTFTVVLPGAAEPAEAGHAPGPRHAPRISGTVLLVDDDDAVREVSTRALSATGLQVVSARDGEEALALADENDFDLVLTDVIMPRMSGPELIARLRAEAPDLKVLYMSGYAPEQMRQPLAIAGAPLIPKPFDPAQLAARVTGLLDDAGPGEGEPGGGAG